MTGGWIVPLVRPAGPAYEIVCFPWAGGGAAGFHPFGRHLDRGVALSAVALPGRQQRLAERIPADLERWVAAIASELEGRAVPLVLLGHSFGAVLAYEVALRLRIAGSAAPGLLCVSSRRAPDLPSRKPQLASAQDRELIAWMRRLGGAQDGVLGCAEILPLILPPLRADLGLDCAYRPSETSLLDLPVLGFAGSDDPCVDAAEMAGWDRVTNAGFRLHVVAGGHFHLTEQPERALTLIRQSLDRHSDGTPSAPAAGGATARAVPSAGLRLREGPPIDVPELTR